MHEHSQAVEVALTVNFPDVGWHWLQQVYGWAALQYQAWARGELLVEGDESQTVLLYTDSVLEYWVDDIPYFGGDYYAYRRAPLVLYLRPGAHKIDIRIIRDVRVMGGMGPSMSIRLKAERSPGGLAVMEKKLLVSDVVNSSLASPYASLPVRNDGNMSMEIRDIKAVSVSTDTSIMGCICSLTDFHCRKIVQLVYSNMCPPQDWLQANLDRCLSGCMSQICQAPNSHCKLRIQLMEHRLVSLLS